MFIVHALAFPWYNLCLYISPLDFERDRYPMDLHSTQLAFVGGIVGVWAYRLICGLHSSTTYASYFIYSDLGAAVEPHMNYNTHISFPI